MEHGLQHRFILNFGARRGNRDGFLLGVVVAQGKVVQRFGRQSAGRPGHCTQGKRREAAHDRDQGTPAGIVNKQTAAAGDHSPPPLYCAVDLSGAKGLRMRSPTGLSITAWAMRKRSFELRALA